MPVRAGKVTSLKHPAHMSLIRLSLILEKYNLELVSKTNWEDYKTYGWQLTKDDESIRK